MTANMALIPILEQALEAERASRFLESFALCTSVIAENAGDGVALNLLGRLSLRGGDLAGAVGLQRTALRSAPDFAQARTDLATALAARPDPAAGALLFAQALALRADIALHHHAPGSQPPFDELARVAELVRAALVNDPALAVAHAALANLVIRQDDYARAVAAYRCALLLEPEHADWRLALSEILHDLGETQSATQERVAALAQTRSFWDPAADAVKVRVLLLLAPLPWSANMPLDFLCDDGRVAIYRRYLDLDALPEEASLPVHDVVINGIGAARNAEGYAQSAERFHRISTRPFVNAPDAVARTARPVLGQVLRGISGVRVAETTRYTATQLARLPIGSPILMRPIDSHAGRGLHRVQSEPERDFALATTDAECYDVTPFVEYRSPDCNYRKYRVVVIDGVPYPYHLAISRRWMVHYVSSEMASNTEYRAEEAAFLAQPRTVFPEWEQRFSQIAKALDLEYVGIDCTLLADGTLFIFEIDPTMLIHVRESAPVFSYRLAAVKRLREAFIVCLQG